MVSQKLVLNLVFHDHVRMGPIRRGVWLLADMFLRLVEKETKWQAQLPSAPGKMGTLCKVHHF